MPVKLTILARTPSASQDRNLPVSDQIEQARSYAEACGFTVVEAAFHSEHPMPLGAFGKLYDMIIVESIDLVGHRAAATKAAPLHPANEDIPIPKKETA